MNKPIGVIGLGDLGGQLTSWITDAGLEAVTFDNDETKIIKNPNVLRLSSSQQVLARCSIVHWAVPSEILIELDDIISDTIVVLHDSVMSNSQTAINDRKDSDSFVVAHALMNQDKRIFVEESENSELVIRHFGRIGLNPKLTTVKDHDNLMAHSQGLVALLVSAGLVDLLGKTARDGDVTPSAVEFLRFLENRKLKWTPTTIRSILSNPELKQVAEDVLGTTLSVRGKV